VDALADFQRFGGEVDEVLSSDLAGADPQTFGRQHGRSIFALDSSESGEIVGIVTADGGTVKASMTDDGFLQLQPASAGFLSRNDEIYRALYPGALAPAYTEEVIFEYIDESGTRLILGGAEVERTTSYLVKKDTETGEIVFRLRRDISGEKASGHFLDPDVSATFPTKVKFCDSKRSDCVTRLIVKKPGDEIRFDPRTQQINVTFNKENIPFWKKYGNAQRLSWACEHRGQGFFITYREGRMGGYSRPGLNEVGNFTCNGGVLRCVRTEDGQRCYFDHRDYMDRPAELALFGLDWFLAKKDPHIHYFTLAPDPLVKKHMRIGEVRNLDTIREVAARPDGFVLSGDGSVGTRVNDELRRSLCGSSSWQCVGDPQLKVLELTSVGEGLVLIDERTGTKLSNIERVWLYSLRKEYGWGDRGEFVAALVANRQGAAEVMALKRLNAEVEAPDLLEKDSETAPEDSVEAMLKDMEEERQREILRVQLAERTQALILFPKESIEERGGVMGHPVVGPRSMPARIVSLAKVSSSSASRQGHYQEPRYETIGQLPMMPSF
jgi:hypothetical protein